MAKTVLIVDDSPSMRAMVASVLRDRGFEVIEGGNGKEALDRIAGRTISVVITDLNMPVMDGIALIKALRARPDFRFTPLLMLTTEAGQARKQEGKAAGATGWLVKPFNPEQLLGVIARVAA